MKVKIAVLVALLNIGGAAWAGAPQTNVPIKQVYTQLVNYIGNTEHGVLLTGKDPSGQPCTVWMRAFTRGEVWGGTMYDIEIGVSRAGELGNQVSYNPAQWQLFGDGTPKFDQNFIQISAHSMTLESIEKNWEANVWTRSVVDISANNAGLISAQVRADAFMSPPPAEDPSKLGQQSVVCRVK